jgi:hypothetical protein
MRNAAQPVPYSHCEAGHVWTADQHTGAECPVCGRPVLGVADAIATGRRVYPKWIAALPVVVVAAAFIAFVVVLAADNGLQGRGAGVLCAIVPLLGVGAMAALIAWYGRRQRERYSAVMHRVADERGFVFAPQMHELLSARVRCLPLFQWGHSQSTANVLQGMLDEIECIICRHRWVTGSGKSRTEHARLVVVLADVPLPLPEFQMAPEQWYHKVGGWLGMKDIGFGGSDEAARFSSRYRLTGSNEDAVRDAFTEPVVNWFADHPGWTIQSSNGFLLLTRPPKQKSFRLSTTTDSVPTFEEALRLIDDSAEAATVLLPPRSA